MSAQTALADSSAATSLVHSVEESILFWHRQLQRGIQHMPLARSEDEAIRAESIARARDCVAHVRQGFYKESYAYTIYQGIRALCSHSHTSAAQDRANIAVRDILAYAVERKNQGTLRF
jgi:hypothetical protein